MNNKELHQDLPVPRLSLWLLRCGGGRENYDSALGDLMETFEYKVEKSDLGSARRWFFLEVIRGIPGFLMNRIYWRIAMLRNYMLIALRKMMSNRMFAVLNLVGLAVGMACFLMINLWIKDETSYDKFHENRDSLYQLVIVHPSGVHDMNSPYALAHILKEKYPEIIAQSRIFELGNVATCSLQYTPEGRSPVSFYEEKVIFVDDSFFSMFSFPFRQGYAEGALDNPSSIVISEAAAARYFSGEDPLGKTLEFNSRQSFTVTGVVHVPSNSHIQFDFAAKIDESFDSNWNWADPSYLLLQKGIDLPAMQEKIAGEMNETYPNPLPGNFELRLLPITKSFLHFGRQMYVTIFTLIAFFILLIACINYMNLATAYSASRAKEVGLRKVVGARLSQLIQQFMGESIVTAAVSLILALFLVRLFLPAVNGLTGKNLSFASIQAPGNILFLLALVLGVGILSGVYPSLYLSSSRPADTLKSTRGRKSKRGVFRIVSVVGQFTISIFLILGTTVIFKQLNFSRSRPLGFQTDQVLQIPLNPMLLSRYKPLKNDLQSIPEVLSVTASQAAPFKDDYKTGIQWPGMNPDLVPNVRYTITKLDYIETFGIELVEGRSLSSEIPGDEKNFLINEEAARYMGMDDPLGKRIRMWNDEGSIVGVVKDFHHVSLHREIMPQVITANPRFQRNLKYLFVKIGPDDIPGTIAAIKEKALAYAPAFPFEYTFLDGGLTALYDSEERLGKISGYFAALAILISCLGIFGLSAYSAERRTKEIGVRKVLGASQSNLTLLLSKDFSIWLIAANFIAWPIGWFVMNRWLQNFAYRTGIGLGVFILAGILSLFFATLPVSYQTWKAASSDPVQSLRYE
jgi:putative ABC transport system permease protein